MELLPSGQRTIHISEMNRPFQIASRGENERGESGSEQGVMLVFDGETGDPYQLFLSPESTAREVLDQCGLPMDWGVSTEGDSGADYFEPKVDRENKCLVLRSVEKE